MSATLLEQLNTNAEQSKATAAEDYAAIVQRFDAPNSGDAERLTNIMDLLAISQTDLEADIAAVKEDRGLRSGPYLSEHVPKVREVADKLLGDVQTRIDTVKEKLAPIQKRWFQEGAPLVVELQKATDELAACKTVAETKILEAERAVRSYRWFQQKHRRLFPH